MQNEEGTPKLNRKILEARLLCISSNLARRELAFSTARFHTIKVQISRSIFSSRNFILSSLQAEEEFCIDRII